MNQSRQPIDWEYWKHVSSLTSQEIACLLADVEPFEWDIRSEPEDPKLKKAYTMVSRAIEDSELGHPCEARVSREKLNVWIPWKRKMETIGIEICI